MKKKYIYRPARVVVTDYGDGRAHMVYKQAGKTLEDVIEQAHWVSMIVHKIADDHPGVPMRFLVDTRRISHVPIDYRVRRIYVDLIESAPIDKNATVVDDIGYARMAVIRLLAFSKREHVRFFYLVEEAKIWLDW